MPKAVVALGEGMSVVGRLRFEGNGRRQHSRFEYASEWLSAPERFALSPGLPLRAGNQPNSGRGDMRQALSGCFADGAPDSWGRALMTVSRGDGLNEFDFLTLSNDRTRPGAIRFLDDHMEPLSGTEPSIPRPAELERLRSLARKFERDPGGEKDEARDLAAASGALGGARPKVNVMDGGHLWIAKFPSIRDTGPVERVEVATLKLAALCGLRVPEARLEFPGSDHPVALIRRFDRRGNLQIPYISARTALGRGGGERGFYTDIADIIRQISARAIHDLRELWRRIVFTILVSNTDDHLKNHGFIYVGENRWRLSPAFDINPSPSRRGMLETGIVRGGPFEASLDIVLDACEFFELTRADAGQQALRMAETVRKHWARMLRDEGVSSGDVRAYADAFECAAIPAGSS